MNLRRTTTRCGAIVAVALCVPLGAAAQDAGLESPGHSVRAERAKRLDGLDVNASGVFLNPAGDILTARHAVAGCSSIYAIKDGRVVEASLRAASQEPDLAVLSTGLKPYLNATLAQSKSAPAGSVGVFTEAYTVLQRMPDRSTTLSNAMTIPGGEGLQLLSGVRPGASGSAVLGGTGLLLGVVVERVATGPGAASITLSRASTRGLPGGATQVHAVTTSQIRQFLVDNDIPFSESDAAQLGPRQSPAARASTLSAGVLCG